MNFRIGRQAEDRRTGEENILAMVDLGNHHSPPHPNGSRPMVGSGHLRSGIRRADLGNGAAPQEQVLRMN